ncbi:unnamed protein product [Acidocella sp. C78]|nr:unnamed protein product [Acidocella sp. C78]
MKQLPPRPGDFPPDRQILRRAALAAGRGGPVGQGVEV